ncbi:hypothetical protein H2199_004755 [Coniosporium tulheliwenetii]|uniref:Uncharacterized protein n=1 Tax=Coniosporium tulheliwenetii TaxID=3383036 RepID=A0ACC2Z487_9PEZI|nr:hypothetical protein H2199_004755 [Cladosporium sp. JES 115]
MQKVIQRTAMAERQAARKALLRTQKQAREERTINRTQRNVIRTLEIKAIKAAHKAQREDWELGSLAPRRDVGDLKDTYGTLDPRRLSPVKPEPKDRIEYHNIVEGDRVVMIKGRDRGKIGEVTELNKETDTVTVRGYNLVDVPVPQWMRKVNADKRPIMSIPQPISIHDVRLVYALPDPVTRIPRDVVVAQLEAVNIKKPWQKRHKEEDKWDRRIAGTNTIIPWPERTKPDEVDNDVDTLRITVEEKTFVPQLLSPPFPNSVIDELRNKYSVFRTRHDDDFIAQKEALDEEAEEKRRSGVVMRTPLQELHAREREARKAQGKPELSEEMLAKLGEIVEAKREAEKKAAGERAAMREARGLRGGRHRRCKLVRREGRQRVVSCISGVGAVLYILYKFCTEI